MAINAKIATTGGTTGYLEFDENSDITLIGYPIFELDSEGCLQPTLDGNIDEFFEINVNNEITPQI